MTAKLATDRRRKKMLAKVHLAKKDLALDDGTYRALLKRTAFKDSARDCTEAELEAVLKEFRRLGWKGERPAPARRGPRPLAEGETASKMRALWLSLYHLGEVRDPSEAALARYVRRMTGVEALQWLDGEEADRAIRALRGWCERIGFRQPDAKRVKRVDAGRVHCGMPAEGAGFAAKVELIELLWQKLIETGAMKTGSFARLDSWLARLVRQVAVPAYLTPAQADQAIEKLGAWLRRVKAKTAEETTPNE